MSRPRILLVGCQSPSGDRLGRALESAGFRVEHAKAASCVDGGDSPPRPIGDRLPSAEFDAVVVALPATPSCSLDTVPAAPLVLVQSELLLGETERWMLPPHAWPRIFLREKDGTGPVLAAVRRLVPDPSRGEK